MSPRIIAAAIAGAFLLPAAAHAQSRVAVPQVELFDTVKGKWVLDPKRCRDIREDFRDARRTTSRRDRREDLRDQRVAACPASAYDFIPDAGQGPKHPVLVSRGRVERKYRGRPLFINGDTIGPDGLPLETAGQTYGTNQVQPYTPAPIARTPQVANPAYNQTVAPQYQQPTFQQQPVQTFQQPTFQQQPTYQQPTFQQPSYAAPTPAPAPAAPSKYEVRNGVIFFLE